MSSGFLYEQAPTTLRQYCNRLGIELPATFNAAEQAADEAAAFLATMPGRSDVADAVRATLTTGRDPLDDEAVADALHGYQLRQVVADVITQHNVTARQQAAVASLDELTEMMRPVFEPAAAAVTAAHQVLGGVDLTDPAAILRRDRKAGAAFNDLTEYSQIINDVRFVWHWLANARSSSIRDGLGYACIVGHDLEHWIAEPINTTREPIDLLRDGWTLELHTYTETAEFLDEADRERRHRDEAERARRLDRAHGRG